MISLLRGNSLTWVLVVAATVVSGGLIGVFNRVVVDTPAWNHLGAIDWAAFSKHADLGPGLIVYPIEAILWTILSVAAAISYRVNRTASRAAGPPIYLAAVCMLAVMALTAKEAPIMLNVPNLGNNEQALRQAFDNFTFWGLYVRGGVIVVAFLANIWALAVLGRPSPSTNGRQAT